MQWKTLPAYQQLFVIALVIVVFYTITSRLLGLWLDPEEIPFKKISRFAMGILFLLAVVKVYVLPERRNARPKIPED